MSIRLFHDYKIRNTSKIPESNDLKKKLNNKELQIFVDQIFDEGQIKLYGWRFFNRKMKWLSILMMNTTDITDHLHDGSRRIFVNMYHNGVQNVIDKDMILMKWRRILIPSISEIRIEYSNSSHSKVLNYRIYTILWSWVKWSYCSESISKWCDWLRLLSK